MSNNLRSKIIRLAHANPALRPHLLPLLNVRVADGKVKKNKDGSFLINLPKNLEDEQYSRHRSGDEKGVQEVQEEMYSWVSKKTGIPLAKLKSKYDWNTEDFYEPVTLVPR